MHLLVSLASHGWHPAAWRVADVPGFAGAEPFRAMARLAERGGVDAVLVGPPSAPRALRESGRLDGIRMDPLPLLGTLIGATDRIGLCAWWPGDVAEPFHVARVFATLDHLSLGRTGWITGLEGAEERGERYRYAKFPDSEADQAARLGELIDVARQLWDSWEDQGFVVDQASGTFADPEHVHPIDHAGRFFTVRGPLNVPRPVQGQPVIIHRDMPEGPMQSVAAISAELVLAECATMTMAEAVTRRRDWQTLAQQHGRDPEALRFIVRIMPILAGTEEAALARAAELDRLADGASPPENVVRFVGTPERFADWLAQWRAAGACDGFDILPAVMPLDLAMVVEQVVPLLRRRDLRPAGYEQASLRGHLGLQRAASRFAA